jgi:hypothetical protein
MASGLLMKNDLPPLSIPAKLLQKYNAGMLKWYETGEAEEMVGFFRECHGRLRERFRVL